MLLLKFIKKHFTNSFNLIKSIAAGLFILISTVALSIFIMLNFQFIKKPLYKNINLATTDKIHWVDKTKIPSINRSVLDRIEYNHSHFISELNTVITEDAKIKNSITIENALIRDGKKIAYLTFDDGPSTTVTPKILSTLKKYNINATFFLIGQNINQNPQSKELVNNIYNDGNSIGNHTYTHNLKKLYPNNRIDVDYFMGEVDKTNYTLREVLGNNFRTRLLRLPGGYMSRSYYHDPNLTELNKRLKEENLFSVDWNAYDFDAEGKKKNSKELLQMVKTSVGNNPKVIILMHDTYGKEETANALPDIIEYLRSKNYEFKTLQ
ncbi:polysaccharide deacetylase family protein [Clostridium manihotivorum]|uniref:Polysaccharide deacetylase n=1 Tax=Clostridium manihotivorum TaxID=2320868 RepID=A0A410DRD1_9CLOT|nr:polysaccharide deacetylase family protein [Clostridium manihotivorum]QAA31602.1 polysaccharide deacetylase [Clostridium manihotivorum]